MFSLVLQALPFALVVGGLLVLAYFYTPSARRSRLQRDHARQMKTLREMLPAQPVLIEYAAHTR